MALITCGLKAALAAALLWPAINANASLITLTFDDLQAGDYNRNLNYNGFRFSPNCNLGIHQYTYPTLWIGAWAPCGETLANGFETWNPEFLGPDELKASEGVYQNIKAIYIDFGGHPFSVISFESRFQNSFWTSSKGGYYNTNEHLMDCVLNAPPESDCEFHSLSGGDWAGVKWVMFQFSGGTGVEFGFDNLVVRVPTPGTLALFLLGIAGLVFSRRAGTDVRPRSIATMLLGCRGALSRRAARAAVRATW